MTQTATNMTTDTCCTTHAPTIGAFCWIELLTNDPAVANSSYCKLLGWQATGNDMGAMMYTT